LLGLHLEGPFITVKGAHRYDSYLFFGLFTPL
jgi:N-acetylglucosamine-6-phosphate deacetylase